MTYLINQSDTIFKGGENIEGYELGFITYTDIG